MVGELVTLVPLTLYHLDTVTPMACWYAMVTDSWIRPLDAVIH